MKIIMEKIMNKMFEKIIEGISQMIIYWGTGLICSKFILNYGVKALSNPKMIETISKILVTSGIQGSNLAIVNKVVENSSSDLPLKAAAIIIDKLNPFNKEMVSEQVVNTVVPKLIIGADVAKNIVVDHHMDFLTSMSINGGIFSLSVLLINYINPNFFEHMQNSIISVKDLIFGKSDFSDVNLLVRIVMIPGALIYEIFLYDVVTMGLFVGMIYGSYKIVNFFRAKSNKYIEIIENE